jgi:hypothetical protein
MSKFWGLVGLAASVATVMVSAAAASDAGPPLPRDLKGMLGLWSITVDDDSVPQCLVKLRAANAIGGYRLDVPKACAKDYPVADLAAWNAGTGDEIIFIDVLRHVVFRFTQEEDGLYATDPAKPPHFSMSQPSE